MRILLWNCNNGLGSREQIDYFHTLAPDLAILPELKSENVKQLGANSHSWITNNFSNSSPKGLGVLGFGEVKVVELERDGDMELFMPLAVHSPELEFNLVAVWNFYHACKGGRFRGVKGDGALEWAAIAHYAASLSAPCLFGGDWNFGPTFSQRSFLRMCNLFAGYGYSSLYHVRHSLDLEQSRHSTFRSPTGHYHHLDHLFATGDLCARMLDYEVLPVDGAVRSDHAPILLTLR
jgi:exonuclease III